MSFSHFKRFCQIQFEIPHIFLNFKSGKMPEFINLVWLMREISSISHVVFKCVFLPHFTPLQSLFLCLWVSGVDSKLTGSLPLLFSSDTVRESHLSGLRSSLYWVREKPHLSGRFWRSGEMRENWFLALILSSPTNFRLIIWGVGVEWLIEEQIFYQLWILYYDWSVRKIEVLSLECFLHFSLLDKIEWQPVWSCHIWLLFPQNFPSLFSHVEKSKCQCD